MIKDVTPANTNPEITKEIEEEVLTYHIAELVADQDVIVAGLKSKISELEHALQLKNLLLTKMKQEYLRGNKS